MLELTKGNVIVQFWKVKREVNVKENSSQAKTTTNLKKSNSLKLQGESNAFRYL